MGVSMNKIIESPTRLRVIIKNLMSLFRARKKMAHIEIVEDGPTRVYKVIDEGKVVIQHCPIVELEKDRRCIKTNCPLNKGTVCEEVDPPGLYDNIRP